MCLVPRPPKVHGQIPRHLPNPIPPRPDPPAPLQHRRHATHPLQRPAQTPPTSRRPHPNPAFFAAARNQQRQRRPLKHKENPPAHLLQRRQQQRRAIGFRLAPKALLASPRLGHRPRQRPRLLLPPPRGKSNRHLLPSQRPLVHDPPRLPLRPAHRSPPRPAPLGRRLPSRHVAGTAERSGFLPSGRSEGLFRLAGGRVGFDGGCAGALRGCGEGWGAGGEGCKVWGEWACGAC